MSTNLILPLTSNEATLARAGGKGANLASLRRVGFDVPSGFIITTDAYRAFVDANSIGAALLQMVEMLVPDDPESLDATSAQIRNLFMGGTLPDAMTAAIKSDYAALSELPLPVAVRSSATAEDLPGLSFAGQQDTYLNIVGTDALIEAVKSCWASLWTARAMGYRARNHINPADVTLAVVVQQMIPSEVSGILFTANPLTGHRGETVIDASFGLGEAIVSGQVEPDHYVVDRHEMHITSRKLGAKKLAILPRSGGGTDSITQEKREQQALPDDQILELATIAEGVATHFGSPQDIEWTWADGKLYLLQSRPITSLYPVPDRVLQSPALRLLFSFNSLQGFIEPFTVLGAEIFPQLAANLIKRFGVRESIADIFVIAGGRIYLDITGLAQDSRLQMIVLGLLGNADPGALQTFRTLLATGRIKTVSTATRFNIMRTAFKLRLLIFGVMRAWRQPEGERTRQLDKVDHYLTHVQKEMTAANTLSARLAVIDKFAENGLFDTVFFSILPLALTGIVSQFIIDRWLVNWIGEAPKSVRKLLRGLPGNPTTEMDLILWDTAQKIRADSVSTALFKTYGADEIAKLYREFALPPVAQQALQNFLNQYGMRAVGEIDMGRPRWREDPRSIIQTLTSFLSIDDPINAPDHLFQTARTEVELKSAEYIAQVRQKKGKIRARLFQFVLRRMQLSGIREMPKFYMVKFLDLFRIALLDSGQALVAQGRLAQPDDIFFLSFETLRNLDQVDLKSLVTHNRDAYELDLARRQIPRLILSTGEVFYQGVSEAGPNELLGDGVSPGSVEGKVRVVHDPRGVRLIPGEILVCPATDPGWTPLFLSAGGLVTEMGGMMTHGSVVAREYGIPAVVGVDDATRRLTTGQRIRVDGSSGRVTLLDALSS